MLSCNGAVAPFGRCLLDVMGVPELPLSMVGSQVQHPRFRLERNGVDAFQLHKSDDTDALPLFHHEACPCRVQRNVSLSGNVQLAACVVAVNRGKILITRRALTMRSFKGVWVLPGGHRDAAESLDEAAARELREETGLITSVLKPVAFYESVFPPECSEIPKRQHLVAYFVAHLSDESIKALQCCADEIDRYAWLTPAQLAIILDPLADSSSHCYDAVQVPSGDLLPNLDLHPLRGQVGDNGSYGIDRLSTGTQYVLKQMLHANLI